MARLSVLAVLVLSFLASASCTSQPSDVAPQAKVDVADIESPSSITHRAEHLLGNRFVETRINPDRSTYVVTVLNLKPDEEGEILAKLERQAPVELRQGMVPTAKTMALRHEIERAFIRHSSNAQLVGSNAAGGYVLVGAGDRRAMRKLAKTIEGVTVGADHVARRNRQIVISTATNDPSTPHIVIKLVGLSGDL